MVGAWHPVGRRGLSGYTAPLAMGLQKRVLGKSDMRGGAGGHAGWHGWTVGGWHGDSGGVIFLRGVRMPTFHLHRECDAGAPLHFLGGEPLQDAGWHQLLTHIWESKDSHGDTRHPSFSSHVLMSLFWEPQVVLCDLCLWPQRALFLHLHRYQAQGWSTLASRPQSTQPLSAHRAISPDADFSSGSSGPEKCRGSQMCSMHRFPCFPTCGKVLVLLPSGGTWAWPHPWSKVHYPA